MATGAGGRLDGSRYCEAVQAAAARADVVLTGFITGEPLRQLYAHAGVFVLPSSHEGLPIALLEALSYGLPVIASDIPANLELALAGDCYFPMGDTQRLASRLAAAALRAPDAAAAQARRDWVLEHYDWDVVARQTLSVYQRILRTP